MLPRSEMTQVEIRTKIEIRCKSKFSENTKQFNKILHGISCKKN